jgi:hypothetical protein
VNPARERIDAAGRAFQRQRQAEADLAAERRRHGVEIADLRRDVDELTARVDALTARQAAPEPALLVRGPGPAGSIRLIQDRVAKHYNLTRHDLVSDRRSRDLSRARFVAFFLVKELTPFGSAVIGRAFGDRDHTTVLHGLKALPRMVAAAPPLAAEIERSGSPWSGILRWRRARPRCRHERHYRPGIAKRADRSARRAPPVPAVIATAQNPIEVYEAACQALAAVVSVDAAVKIADQASAIKEWARRAKNRELEITAAEIRIRAERRLGELLAADKAAGGFNVGGRPPSAFVMAGLDPAIHDGPVEGVDHRVRPGDDDVDKTGSEEEQVFPTLAEIGIDRKLSSRAQQLAALPEEEFTARLQEWRKGADRDGGRVTVRLVRGDDFSASDGPGGARSIMASRQEPAESLDYFPTPPWATRALLEHLIPAAGIKQIGWDPACGEGHITAVLEERFNFVIGSDIFDYSADGRQPPSWAGRSDFLAEGEKPKPKVHWIVTNPPFGDLTIPFILRALELAQVGVAMFLRLQCLEGVDRFEQVFRDHPPTIVAPFAERVNLCKGRWDPEGSTATAYMWVVWVKGLAPRPLAWIPPGQRLALERPDDRTRFTAHPVLPEATRIIEQLEAVSQ